MNQNRKVSVLSPFCEASYFLFFALLGAADLAESRGILYLATVPILVNILLTRGSWLKLIVALVLTALWSRRLFQVPATWISYSLLIGGVAGTLWLILRCKHKGKSGSDNDS
jgi:hypothetical protein